MKLGILGSGFVARFHVIALQQVIGIELTAVLNRRGAAALAHGARQQHLGPARLYDRIGEMANAVDVLALYVPNDRRVAVMEEIVDAVKAGAALRGVICEKPLGRNVAEARRLVTLAAEAQLRTAYFENQIHMKPVQKQREQLLPVQRTMGPLVLARAAEEHSGPHAGWFWDPVRQGGGTLSDMGCHSIALGRHLLTPADKDVTFLEPQAVSASIALLKWGLSPWREQLLATHGVDYAKTPAEDFATGLITYKNPETGQRVQAQFTNSWMYDKQGLRLWLDGLGPGYAVEANSLASPLSVFISDAAAAAVADQEAALEKATASRGWLTMQYNEADLYGYTDENADAAAAFAAGQDALLSWHYGLEITRLVMAAYMAAERRQTIDLTDAAIQQELETFVPAVQQGLGRHVL
jgi:predicted dehydrogenase